MISKAGPEAFDNLVAPDGAPRAGAPLGALLTAQALRDPKGAALTAEGRTANRAELDAAANRRARRLAELGVGADDVVAIALPNGHAYYETVFAAWKLGATPMHLSHKLTPKEFGEILALGQPSLTLTADADPGHAEDPSPLPPRAAAAWKVSTSGGSTGRPKLIVDPNPAIWSPDKEGQRRQAGAVIINPGPLYHSAPFGQMLPALAQGAHVIDMGRFDAETWLRLVEQYRADWVYLVPTMMARIAALPGQGRYDLSSIRTLVHMAAPCSEPVKRFWIERIGAEAVWEIYGGTERFGATVINGADWLRKPGSVGRPREGNEAIILDEDGAELPRGEVGEIWFRRPGGPDATHRYVGAETRRRDDWASFGDLGRMDEDGYLYIADRRTDLIISGAVNLYPAEIEAALEGLDGVIGAVVVGVPHADLGQVAHAVVQVERDGAVAEAAVKAWLEGRLARVKHPRSMEFTTEVLRSDAGKVRRSAWRERVMARGGQT